MGVVEQVRVGRRGDGLGVVRLERVLDVLGVVAEVEHERAGLARGWIRLSRDRVCTAASPVRVLSTYMVYSCGWSKPVWYFSATTRIW